MSTLPSASPRRSYVRPVIRVHGDVKEVTRNVGNKSKTSDGATGKTSKTF